MSKEFINEVSRMKDLFGYKKGQVISEQDYILSEDIRRVKLSSFELIPETEWIFKKCTDFVKEVNSKYFNYDLANIEPMQFIVYNENSFQKKHIDMSHRVVDGYTRKLSYSIQLNSNSEYTGGDLVLYFRETPDIIKREIGVATFFPSYALHEVTPVTSGTRYSLVGWCSGAPFK